MLLHVPTFCQPDIVLGGHLILDDIRAEGEGQIGEGHGAHYSLGSILFPSDIGAFGFHCME